MRAHTTRSGCESFGMARPWCRGPVPLQSAQPDVNHAVTALYLAHYRPLVRLAALLVQDLATAEEIVQDAFVWALWTLPARQREVVVLRYFADLDGTAMTNM